MELFFFSLHETAACLSNENDKCVYNWWRIRILMYLKTLLFSLRLTKIKLKDAIYYSNRIINYNSIELKPLNHSSLTVLP